MAFAVLAYCFVQLLRFQYGARVMGTRVFTKAGSVLLNIPPWIL